MFDTPKIARNVFQLILLTLGVLYNIPKVYQDRSTESDFFKMASKMATEIYG